MPNHHHTSYAEDVPELRWGWNCDASTEARRSSLISLMDPEVCNNILKYITYNPVNVV